MNNKKQTAMGELLSIINGVLEYSHNPLLQQIADAGANLLQKEKDQHADTWDKAMQNYEERGHVFAKAWADFDDYYSQTYQN